MQTRFTFIPPEGEVNTLPSMTIPDQSLSIREIFERYAQGRPLDNISRSPFYDDGAGEDDFEVDPIFNGNSDLVDLLGSSVDDVKVDHDQVQEKE